MYITKVISLSILVLSMNSPGTCEIYVLPLPDAVGGGGWGVGCMVEHSISKAVGGFHYDPGTPTNLDKNIPR